MHQRRKFRGHLGGQKVELSMAMPTTMTKAYGRVIEKLTNYVCICASILTKKLGAFVATEKSQDFLFQWDLTSDRLIDFRESMMVEHNKSNERHGRRSY